MSYLVIAMLAGFLLALFNNIADLFTITDFETMHGPIICIPKDQVKTTLEENNAYRTTILSVTYTDTNGNKQHTYLRAPANLMGMTDSSKQALVKKALRRDSRRPQSVIKFTSLA